MHAKVDVKRLMKALRYKGDGDKRSANACIDGLLWVGNAPKKYETVDDFLKEALLRGCCRQLPYVPSWVVFGKTKFFLAHRDEHKVPSRGSVFGYFVLHRVEIITQNEVAQSLSKIQNSKFPWPRNVEDYDSLIKKWKKKKYPPRKIERRLEEKMVQKRYLIDLASGKTAKKPWSTKFAEIMESIDPTTKKLIKRLIRKLIEKWLKRDNGGCFPPDDSTKGEGHRMCSIRKGPGSVYAVDALCATVHDTYQQLLRQYLSAESKKSGKNEQEILRRIQRENQESWKGWVKYKRDHKWNAQDLLERYKGPFYEAVKTHFRPDRRPKYPIDPRLRSKASNYGELIVFKKPFPILEKAPQAAFKGICRIDGDKLIDQIAKHIGKKALVPTIYFCKEKEPPSRPLQKIVTKEELATWLAQELHVSKACATRFLDKVSLKAREQLQDFQKFKLPGIGTIRLQSKKARKKIKFSPAKAIRSIESRKKID